VANVVLLIVGNSTIWFHSINTPTDVQNVYDYVERLLGAGRFLLPAGTLRSKVFRRYDTDAVVNTVIDGGASTSCREPADARPPDIMTPLTFPMNSRTTGKASG
jgi:hypothetical protein